MNHECSSVKLAIEPTQLDCRLHRRTLRLDAHLNVHGAILSFPLSSSRRYASECPLDRTHDSAMCACARTLSPPLAPPPFVHSARLAQALDSFKLLRAAMTLQRLDDQVQSCRCNRRSRYFLFEQSVIF